MRLLSLLLLLLVPGIDSPFGGTAKVRVLIFARTDCPVTNRYAPEIARIAEEFSTSDVRFWMVYSDRAATREVIRKHMEDYRLPGVGIGDPDGSLRRRSEAKIAPQAAVFNAAGKLMYSGRIDDRFVAFGRARPAPTVHDLEEAIKSVLAGKPVAVSRTRAIGCYLDDVK